MATRERQETHRKSPPALREYRASLARRDSLDFNGGQRSTYSESTNHRLARPLFALAICAGIISGLIIPMAAGTLLYSVARQSTNLVNQSKVTDNELMGMDKNQVRKLLGEPDDISRSTLGSGSESWHYYNGSRDLFFQHGKVTLVNSSN
jgi:hypothetical protein